MAEIPETFKELVGQSIGEASMCWSEAPKGVFESDRASKIVDKIIAYHLEVLEGLKITGCNEERLAKIKEFNSRIEQKMREVK